MPGRIGYVYFIRAAELGMVKIGWTNKSPLQRLAELATASPVELALVCAMHGSYKQEQELHATFAALRVRGEWFREEGALADFILSVSGRRFVQHAGGAFPPGTYRYSRTTIGLARRGRYAICDLCGHALPLSGDAYLFRASDGDAELAACVGCARRDGKIHAVIAVMASGLS